jgi:hypothetical protein
MMLDAGSVDVNILKDILIDTSKIMLKTLTFQHFLKVLRWTYYRTIDKWIDFSRVILDVSTLTYKRIYGSTFLHLAGSIDVDIHTYLRTVGSTLPASHWKC